MNIVSNVARKFQHKIFHSLRCLDHFSIGIRKDGDGNLCDPDDEYIMSLQFVSNSPTKLGNIWKFSNCSVEYLDNIITSLNK